MCYIMVIEQMFDGGGRMHEKKTGRKIDREFIPASNEPSSHACMDIWRLPRGSNTPLLCSAASLIPRCLQRGL